MKRPLRISPLFALLIIACRSVLGIDDPTPCDVGCSDGGAAGVAGANHSAGAPVVGTEDEGGSAGAATPPGGTAGVSGSPSHAGGPSNGGASSGAAGEPEAGSGGQVGCISGTTRCDAYQRQSCDGGLWTNLGGECPGFCSNGECDQAPSCKSDLLCSGAGCCDTIWVPGGSYQMGKGDNENPDLSYARTVDGFYLDRFEVTVGRFKEFMAHFSLPKPGEGAYPKLGAATGWDLDWQTLQHPDFDDQLAVPSSASKLLQQWTDDCDAGSTAGDTDTLPANCVNWYAAFAFCVYDHGRLPTEAEWNYAAAAGERQLPYPFSQGSSDIFIDATKAVYHVDGQPYLLKPLAVGSKSPVGSGLLRRYPDQGFEDLAGNLVEWTLDEWSADPPASCTNCVEPWSKDDELRVVHDGSFANSQFELRTGSRNYASASTITSYFGFRCARDANTSTKE